MDLHSEKLDIGVQLAIVIELKKAALASHDVREFLFERLDHSRKVVERMAAIQSLEPTIALDDVHTRLGENLLKMGTEDEAVRTVAVRMLGTHLEIEAVRQVLIRELKGSTNLNVRVEIGEVFAKYADRLSVRESLMTALRETRRARSADRLLEAIAPLRSHADIELGLFSVYEESDDQDIRRLIARVLQVPREQGRSQARAMRCESVFGGRFL
jgi:hypothetical protein